METSLSSLFSNAYIPFLSFLWGRETRERKNKRLQGLIVLILPMRNGNKEILKEAIIPYSNSSYPTYEEWKRWRIAKASVTAYQFLSYLWGMETEKSISSKHARMLCSYPTYEEWKHSLHVLLFLSIQLRSYPTYEEWKLKLIWHSPWLKSVLILPMRNGNFEIFLESNRVNKRSYPTYEEWKQYVYYWKSMSSLVQFLSYLWGMETEKQQQIQTTLL